MTIADFQFEIDHARHFTHPYEKSFNLQRSRWHRDWHGLDLGKLIIQNFSICWLHVMNRHWTDKKKSAFVQLNIFVAGALAGGSWLSQERILEFGWSDTGHGFWMVLGLTDRSWQTKFQFFVSFLFQSFSTLTFRQRLNPIQRGVPLQNHNYTLIDYTGSHPTTVPDEERGKYPSYFFCSFFARWDGCFPVYSLTFLCLKSKLS